MPVPTVLIVDDHPLFRDALNAALEQAYPDGSKSLEASTLAEAANILGEEQISLVLLDLNLSDSSNFDGLTRLRGIRANTPIYVVSATESAEAFSKARSLGANGYLPKSLSMEDLSAALATALDGGSWFPKHDAPKTDDDIAERIASLTPAQKRVLSGLTDGLLNKQIAFDMGISEATVKAHMTAIFRKLGANNRTQALLIYKSATSLDDHSAA